MASSVKKKLAVEATVSIAFVSALVTGYIQLDQWLIEREQLRYQLRFEREVNDCKVSGGRWYKGNCEPVP